MSKIKELAAVHEKYIISVEHQLEPVPAVKAKLTIPGENNTYAKQVQTLFIPSTSLEKAEEAAVNRAISMILGDKQTKSLVESAEMFDISTAPFIVRKANASTGSAEVVGVKATVIAFKEMKPYRTVSAFATGADIESVEKEALKSAINKVMGVK